MRRIEWPILVLLIMGCSPQQAPDTSTAAAVEPNAQAVSAIDDPVWAVNIGGGAYTATDGIRYVADTLETDARKGEISQIKGTQDPVVFKTYRMGDLRLNKPVKNGVYAVTFMFAEPDDVPVGGRVFNILAEGKPVIKQLDVRQARDGNPRASLYHTAVEIAVDDGRLNIDFEAVKGEPILNALVIRKKLSRNPSWELFWADEFNYQGSPDPEKWTHDVWPARKVNSEDQAYTDRPKNVRVENGNLVIEAHLEDYDNAKYTSGRIHSAGKGDMLYGRVEARAKLPAGQGTWSAIWMLPSDPYRYSTSCKENEDWQGSESCDAWPNSGEIDILEHVGYDMNKVHGTVHTKAYYWVNGEQRKASVAAPPVDQEFHDYALEWSPDRIDIFFDDVLYYSYLNESSGWRTWPFDHPYHVILNLAIGGDWGRAGGPIDEAALPAKMEVDYVRLYQKPELLSER